MRSGMQLKNWARFRGSTTKKRQHLISEDALPLLVEMHRQGKSAVEISKHFNVVPATVRSRIRSLREEGKI